MRHLTTGEWALLIGVGLARVGLCFLIMRSAIRSARLDASAQRGRCRTHHKE